MSKTLKACIAVGIVILSYAVIVEADIKKEKGYYVSTTDKTFSVEKNGTVFISTTHGSLEAVAASGKDLRIIVKLYADTSSQSKAEQYFSHYDISLKQSGNDVRLEIDDKYRSNNNKVNISVMVEVPKEYNIDFDSGGGSIKATDLFGNVKASTGGGSIKIGNVTGDIHAKTGGGSIKVGNVKGIARITTGGGSVEISNVSRDVDISTGGGSIDIEKVDGEAIVRTGGGSISVGPLKGDADISTGGGSIKIKESEGKIKASTGGGSIKVDGSKGPVNVTTGGGSISIAKAKGSIYGSTGGGSIMAEILDLPKDGGVKLSTGGGDIKIYINEKLSFTIDAEIDLHYPKRECEFTSDFKLNVKKDSDGIKVTGDVNGGGPKIILRTTNSNIKIYKL